MSNNNNQKPAMMAVVSAAQKKSVNINNALTKSNVPNQSATAKKSLIQNAPNCEENPLINTLNDSQKSASGVAKEAIKTVIDTAVQHQNKIISDEESTNNSILTSNTKPTETHNNQPKNVDFNNHIVSLLCDGIRNVQNQTFNFTQKLSQSRAIKKQSLTDMQKIACDNFNELSHTYINATQKSLGTINPIDLLKNQTQCITQFHNVCANMVSTMSQTSFDIIKQNCNFSWFYNNTNQK